MPLLRWLLIRRAVCLFKILVYGDDDNDEDGDDINIFISLPVQALGQAFYTQFLIESAPCFNRFYSQ